MRRLVLFWLTSLVVVSMAAFALAQSRLPEPRIRSGNDIGFRVEGLDPSGKPIGRLMIRYNGAWVEVGASMAVRPVK